eukprot:jgi/Botrbrau1/20830/Bobra.0156s0055.1
MASFGEDNSDLTTRAVLKRDIPWDSFLTARLISDNELQLIRRYDKRPPDVQNDLLIERARPGYRCSTNFTWGPLDPTSTPHSSGTFPLLQCSTAPSAPFFTSFTCSLQRHHPLH